jgi:hopene-associated glycosyltransferase HpnB
MVEAQWQTLYCAVYYRKLARAMQEIGLVLVSISLLIWLGLLGLRGQFWQTDPVLEQMSKPQSNSQPKSNSQPQATASPSPAFRPPAICAIVPARNEAELLPITLRSLLQQTYPGVFQVMLVDDHSTDDTAEVARQTAATVAKTPFQVIRAQPLPVGWSGKLWAMQQGVQAAGAEFDYLLLTDADIHHDPANLERLVEQAVMQDLDLASVMVRLRCESFWEQLLIPAFVFFFAKLYPFRWVNDPHKTTAAAAGGCILIRRTALEAIGGLNTIRQALIDDCALAQAIKQTVGKQEIAAQNQNSEENASNHSGRIWLGLSDQTCSLRLYPSLQTIWDMVARTAFTQLRYSWPLLVGTVAGMSLVYLMPILGLLLGIILGDTGLIMIGLAGWLLMSLAYLPMVQFYRCSPLFAGSLPLIALLYTLMTVDSALRYWQGSGGAWKGRVYPHQSEVGR